MTIADVKQVTAAVRDNRQVREASQMPVLIEQLFELTADVVGAVPVWLELALWLRQLADERADTGVGDVWTYPGLVRLLELRGAHLAARPSDGEAPEPEQSIGS